MRVAAGLRVRAGSRVAGSGGRALRDQRQANRDRGGPTIRHAEGGSHARNDTPPPHHACRPDRGERRGLDRAGTRAARARRRGGGAPRHRDRDPGPPDGHAARHSPRSHTRSARSIASSCSARTSCAPRSSARSSPSDIARRRSARPSSRGPWTGTCSSRGFDGSRSRGRPGPGGPSGRGLRPTGLGVRWLTALPALPHPGGAWRCGPGARDPVVSASPAAW